MQLYLDSYGAFLAARNGMFAVRIKSGGEQQFAVRDVQAILLTKSTGLSTDAALLAASNAIPVLIIDANTHYPLAQVSSGRLGSIAAIRKNQALFARAPAGFDWVALQLAEKIGAQRALLTLLAEDAAAPAGFGADVRLADRVLLSLETEFRKPVNVAGFDIETTSGLFRGREGTASRLYFNQLAKVLTGTFAAVVPEPEESSIHPPPAGQSPEPDSLRAPRAEFRTWQKRPAYTQRIPTQSIAHQAAQALVTLAHVRRSTRQIITVRINFLCPD